jgi:two-component system, NarL family, invasion response regulator UvrY
MNIIEYPSLVIFEKRPIFAEAIKCILDSILDDIIIAKNKADVLTLIEKQSFTIVLVDLSMHGEEISDILMRNKKMIPKIFVILINSHKDETLALKLLKNGAYGYLSSASTKESLIHSIEAICQGEKYIDSESLKSTLYTKKKIVSFSLPHEKLSDREYQIFIMIAKGYTVGEIAKELYLSVKTISTYRRRLLDKLSFVNNAELVQYALKNVIGFL